MIEGAAHLIIVAGAVIIWWILTTGFGEYYTDLNRQKLFAIRNQFFDEAANQRIPFDSDAYGLVRTTLNGAIRFTHEIGFLKLVFTAWLLRSARREFSRSPFSLALEQVTRDLNPYQKALIERTLADMNKVLVLQVFQTSLVLKPIYLLASAHWILQRFKRRVSQGLENLAHEADIDYEAEQIGASISGRRLGVELA